MTTSDRSSTSGQTQPLRYLDVKPILAKLGELTSDCVLIGGQAINFWADYFEKRSEDLRTAAPFTSGDIDFLGSAELVVQCAVRLNGQAQLASIDDHTPTVGVVKFLDASGRDDIKIDFVDLPYGLDSKEVFKLALLVEILDDRGQPTGTSFRVMHPVLCMESRIHNTIGLAAFYDNPHGRKQLKASITCARLFLQELLDRGEVQAVRRLAKRILRISLSQRGQEVFKKFGFDPFSAVVGDHPKLPEKFKSEFYPRALATLAQKRKRPA